MDDDTRARATANQSKDASPAEEPSREVEETLRVARAQGFPPAVAVALVGLDRVSAKKKASVRNTVVTTVLTALPSDPRGPTEIRPLRRARRARRRPRARLVRAALDAPAVAFEARVRAGGARVARGGDAECILAVGRPEARDRARRVSDVYGGRGGVRPGRALVADQLTHLPGIGDFPLARVERSGPGGAAPASLPPKGAIADLRMRRWTPGRARRSPCPRRARARAAREHPGRAGRRADLARERRRWRRRRRRRRAPRSPRGGPTTRRRGSPTPGSAAAATTTRATTTAWTPPWGDDDDEPAESLTGDPSDDEEWVRWRRRAGEYGSDVDEETRRNLNDAQAGFREAKRAECGGGGGARLSGRDRHTATHPGARALRALPRPEVLPLRRPGILGQEQLPAEYGRVFAFENYKRAARRAAEAAERRSAPRRTPCPSARTCG